MTKPHYILVFTIMGIAICSLLLSFLIARRSKTLFLYSISGCSLSIVAPKRIKIAWFVRALPIFLSVSPLLLYMLWNYKSTAQINLYNAVVFCCAALAILIWMMSILRNLLSLVFGVRVERFGEQVLMVFYGMYKVVVDYPFVVSFKLVGDRFGNQLHSVVLQWHSKVRAKREVIVMDGLSEAEASRLVVVLNEFLAK